MLPTTPSRLALPACTTARSAPLIPRTDSSAPVTSASMSSRGFTRSASRRPPCQVPNREPSESDDDEHVILAPDAVRSVHHDQVGDRRVGHDLDRVVRGPHAHGARRRRRRREPPGGLGRLQPAGRDLLEDLAPVHASPISATKDS